MNATRLLWFGCLLACGSLPRGWAQSPQATEADAPLSGRQKAFKLLDRNDDERLDVEEYVGGTAGKIGENMRAEFAERDRNQDGFLEFGEFKRGGNQAPDDEQLKQDFARRDQNDDGQLTLAEFIGDREGEHQQELKASFYRFDMDENQTVSLEEFLDRDGQRQISAGNQFRMLDLDEDGQLSEQEFMRPKIGQTWEQAARENFRRFDLDGDGQLALREFAITPAQRPDARAWFAGLDVDQNGELTVAELTRFLAERQAGRAAATFAAFDRDGSGGLNLDEYLDRDAALAWQNTRRALIDWTSSWGLAAMLLIDAALIGLAAQFVYRRRSSAPRRASS